MVDVVPIDVLAFVAARDDVIDAVCELDPWRARHPTEGRRTTSSGRAMWNDRHTTDTYRVRDPLRSACGGTRKT
jgi:hypothetical protein